VGNKLYEWHSLVARIAHINLNESLDLFVWSLHKKGSFSVKSMYRHLINKGIKVTQEIWHMKIPLKIKIFMLYLKREVIK